MLTARVTAIMGDMPRPITMVTLRRITAMRRHTMADIPRPTTRQRIAAIVIGALFVPRTPITAAPDTTGGTTADIVTIGNIGACLALVSTRKEGREIFSCGLFYC